MKLHRIKLCMFSLYTLISDFEYRQISNTYLNNQHLGKKTFYTEYAVILGKDSQKMVANNAMLLRPLTSEN